MREIDVLAIGAHMGDEVAWGAALSAHARQGLQVGLLHLTPGEKGHPTKSPEEYAIQKREEAGGCAERLGARIWTLDHRDGELRDDDALKFEVADVLREARPKAVVTHWGGSMHKDHAATHRLLADAIFYAALPGFERTLPPTPGPRVFYGENWEDLEGYVPEVFIELLAEDLDRWEEAMRCYELFRGGVSKFEYLEYYRALARSRGCEAGFPWASTFAIPPRARRQRRASLLT